MSSFVNCVQLYYFLFQNSFRVQLNDKLWNINNVNRYLDLRVVFLILKLAFDFLFDQDKWKGDKGITGIAIPYQHMQMSCY